MARERRQELRDNSYINVQGWMARLTTKVGRALTLPELIIFANIFGYSQDGKSRYAGGVSYLMEFLHLSKPSVLAHLRTLEDSGLIGRIELENGEVDYFTKVFANASNGKEILPIEASNGKDSLPVKNLNRLNNFTENGKEILPNEGADLINNKNNNKNIAPADAAVYTPASSLSAINTERSAKGATPTTPKAPAAPAARGKKREGELTGYGIREVVLLTDKELETLNKEFGVPAVDREIDQLEDYIINGKGAKYKDHYLTLRKWLKRDAAERAALPPVPQYTMYGRPVRAVEARREPRAID